MATFSVPTKDQVSPDNQIIFDNLKSALGIVPNLYVTIAYSKNGLARFLAYQSAKTSLSNKGFRAYGNENWEFDADSWLRR